MRVEPKWHLVIADDRKEFVSYCWRYLTHNIGISTGHVKLPPAEWSPDGTLLLHFFLLDDKENQQALLVKKIAGLKKTTRCAKIFTIIDVAAGEQHKPKTLIKELKNLGAMEAVLIAEPDPAEVANQIYFKLVSAYPFNPKKFGIDHIEAKSLDFLDRLRKFIVGKAEASKIHLQYKNPQRVQHVLITGAGFEMRNSDSDEPGIDTTQKVMLDMSGRFGKDGISLHLFDGFKLPLSQHDKEYNPALKEAAERGNLDDWWDALISNRVLVTLSSKRGGGSLREESKREALLLEMELRDAFRRAFLQLDWGFLGQALDAAQLEWHAWLTTNYTRFSDRAIDAVRSPTEPAWQVLSSVSEARAFSRITLEGRQNSRRFLFKLHGDLAHLQTMAIAGEDKDPISQFPFPVDKLHWIYDTATRYLGNTLCRQEDSTGVVWHVVGHALQDYPLIRLLQDVVKETHNRQKDGWQRFVVADPRPLGPKNELVRHKICKENDVLVYRVKAKAYLAQLRRIGLSFFDSDLDWSINFPERLRRRLGSG